MNTITKRTQRAALKSLTYQPVRCAGGHGHGHDDHHGGHHHAHHFEQSKKMNTQFQVPTQEELDHQLPKHGNINEKLHQWIAGRWAVDRDDILNNDKPNKFAAYFWFKNYSFL